MSRGADNLSPEEYENTRLRITLKARLRTERRWPEKVVANLTAETLDGFIYQNVVAARLVMELQAQGEGLLVIRDFDEENAQAREAVTAVSLPFHKVIRMPGAPEGLLPIDWFDEGAGAPVMSDNPEWQEGGWIGAELLLMPQMLDFDAVTAAQFGALGPVFGLPKEMKTRARAQLEKLGVGAADWFVVVDLEDSDASLALTREIVGVHGGKVLLIQPPVWDKDAEDGVSLLPGGDAGFELRMAAIAMARCFIGGDRFSTTLASAFATPCAFIEGSAYERRVWNEGDLVLKGGGPIEKICQVVGEFLASTPSNPLAGASSPGVRRGVVQAIPLKWPTDKPVVRFID